MQDIGMEPDDYLPDYGEVLTHIDVVPVDDDADLYSAVYYNDWNGEEICLFSGLPYLTAYIFARDEARRLEPHEIRYYSGNPKDYRAERYRNGNRYCLVLRNSLADSDYNRD